MARTNILCILFAVLFYSISSAQNTLACNAVIEFDNNSSVKKLTFFERTDHILRQVIYYDFTPIIEGLALDEDNLSQVIRYEQEPLPGLHSPDMVPRENDLNYFFKRTSESLRIYSDNRYPLILYVGSATKNNYLSSNDSYQNYKLRYPEQKPVLNFRYNGDLERGASFTTWIPSVKQVSYVLPDLIPGDHVAILLVGIFRGCMCGSLAMYFGDPDGINNEKIYIGYEKEEYYRLTYHTFSEEDSGRINFSLRGADHDMSATIYNILVFKAGYGDMVSTAHENKIRRSSIKPAVNFENRSNFINLRGQIVDRNASRTLLLKPPLQSGSRHIQILPGNVYR
ncbi:MAG TPA: hypothetical protein VFD91_14430 [Mariniphaga sp.]|nr:hypothetical protein [Mariniphaga sp.]